MNEDMTQVQNVFLYDRKKLEMTGISDVSAFSDTSVEMTYGGGMIAIDGTDLKIDSFSSETGHICIPFVITGRHLARRAAFCAGFWADAIYCNFISAADYTVCIGAGTVFRCVV